MLKTLMNLPTAIKSLLLLATPIILGQIGQMLIGAGDVYIASRYSTEAVAAIGVANGVFNPLFLFGIGLMMGISPAIATFRGEGKKKQGSLGTIITYSTVCGLALTLLTLIVNQFVPMMGFEAALVPTIQEYIAIVAWSIPFAIVFQAIREYLQAFEDVFFPNALSIFSVFVNLIINYILVFGLFSWNGFGEVGLALASLFTRVFQFAVLTIYVFMKEKWTKPSFKLSKYIFNFSLPIAFMFFLEVLAFCTVTMLSGQISIVAAAANNIIMTMASTAFMVPLSISSAIAVKIGHAYGQKSIELINIYTKAALAIVAIFILFSFGVLFGFPTELMYLASNDPAVIELGIKLLFIVAIFQFTDSIQVVMAGVLRGIHETKITSILVFIGYWLIGIPTGYYLAFYDNQGAQGLWIGLALSLSLVAVLMSIAARLKLKKLQFT